MTPQAAHVVAALVDCGIPIAAGTWITLTAYRKIGPAEGGDIERDAWHRKWGGAMRIIGPLLVAISLLRLALALVTGQR